MKDAAYAELKHYMAEYHLGHITRYEMAAAIHLWQRGQGGEQDQNRGKALDRGLGPSITRSDSAGRDS